VKRRTDHQLKVTLKDKNYNTNKQAITFYLNTLMTEQIMTSHPFYIFMWILVT